MRNLLRDLIDKTIIFLRRIIYPIIYVLNPLLGRKVQVIVLSFHAFSSDGWRFAVPIADFKKQIDFLRRNYKFITAEDLLSYIKGKRNLYETSILITIDDGYKDILKVKNYLKKFSIKPLLFVLSNSKNANRKELETDRKFLTKKDILSFLKDGWSIGSHGATHPDFWSLNEDQISKEVLGSKRTLEKELGVKIKYFAYPKGRYNNSIINCVKRAGYQMGFSMDDGILSPKINKLKIPRVGVDSSYSFFEFTVLFTFWAIQFRKMAKNYFFFIWSMNSLITKKILLKKESI